MIASHEGAWRSRDSARFGSAWIASVAVFLFLAFVGLVYGVEFIILARWIAARKQGRPWKTGWKSYVIHGMSAIGILCFAYGYFVEPYRLEVTPVTIRTDKLAHTRLRVVQFSDTHCDRKIRNERKLVEIINALEPDIIVFTGDTLNTPEALGRFRDMMKSLHAGLGKYAVRGNFDVWYWSQLDLFKDTGFMVLDRDSGENAKSTIYYIDIRAIDRFEEFYAAVKRDPCVRFVKSKVARVAEDQASQDVVLHGVDTEGYHRYANRHDLVVLAIGMQPSIGAADIPAAVVHDSSGFIESSPPDSGLFGAGCATNALDVNRAVQSSTAAALRAIQVVNQVARAEA